MKQLVTGVFEVPFAGLVESEMLKPFKENDLTQQPDLMQSMVHDQFAKMFDAIEDATVYSEKILDNGSRVTYRYTCSDAGLLAAYVVKAIKKIDPYRSPKASSCYVHGGKHAIDITTYGLD